MFTKDENGNEIFILHEDNVIIDEEALEKENENEEGGN